MALKDILVHVDTCKSCPARLRSAVALAKSHGAYLTGLYVMTTPNIPTYVLPQFPLDVLEEQARLSRQAAAREGETFKSLIEEAGVSGEWRCVEGQLAETLSLHARYADLVIVGQKDPDNAGSARGEDMPDRLILSVGRPVLVTPYSGEHTVIGKNILVAWDAGRLAGRAVGDAMPFIEAADTVCVLAVDPDGAEEDGHGDIPCADIGKHLARHGVSVKVENVPDGDVGEGNMILSRAADRGADMIVMGAYGHARWRELVMGGVTRHMLGHMTVPVLMSH